MEHINRRIADRILDELDLQEKSQRWLCKAAGIPLTSLSRKLKAKTPFTIVELHDIAEALDQDLHEILTAQVAVPA